jgi:hypothetical protein
MQNFGATNTTTGCRGVFFSLFLSRREGGLRGHKNMDLFKRVVEEVFFNKFP